MQRKKRVAAVVTEYWEGNHTDVIVTRMLEGSRWSGHSYASTLEIVSLYIDQFPDNDIGRELAAKHSIPLYGSIEEALTVGGAGFDVDGIILIGEHGDYPENERGQILYPRRRLFEGCLQVMLAAGRFVPVYSDKGFAVVQEDIEWVYEQIKRYGIPFMSSSVVPFAPQSYDALPPPNGTPLERMFAFSYDFVGESPERYTYHVLEMLQCVAENRAYGESGIAGVSTYEGQAAIDRVYGPDWKPIYQALCGFLNLENEDRFLFRMTKPLFFEVHYNDGLQAGIFHADTGIEDFTAAFQTEREAKPSCREFRLQRGSPHSHFSRLVLEIEKFIHTSRPPYPVERSLLTTGALDAIMQSIHSREEVKTPYLQVLY